MSHKRLDGWKAIAGHMNRSVRQCQRLAESGSLPVRRVPGSRAIFAYVHELDRWLAGDSMPTIVPAEAHLTTSGRHVLVPLAENPLDGTAADAPALQAPISAPRRVAVWVAVGVGILLLLALGIHFYDRTGWRSLGTPLTGSWTLSDGGIVGRGASVARFDTGFKVGPGSSVAVTLRSESTRWAGGIEIFDDDLHWTFVAISPHQSQIDLQRFPSGAVSTFFAGDTITAAVPVRLKVTLGRSRLEICCPQAPDKTISLDPWDVGTGRLFLRVGCPGDELHDASGGRCMFRDLQVTGSLAALPRTVVARVPAAQRPRAHYTLAADTIDDQLDVMLDGRRVATGRYSEKIGPLSLDPFLTRGRHTITAILFNRKWTSAYGIRLTENGSVLWERRCGSVGAHGAECKALGTRLGMVQELHYTFEAR